MLHFWEMNTVHESSKVTRDGSTTNVNRSQKRHRPVPIWEERRHQADMILTYKTVTGKDMVSSETWFTSVTESGRQCSRYRTLNLRSQASKMKIKRQFFSQRVAESWNKIPPSLKQAKNVKCFKNWTKHEETTRKGVWTTTIV